MSIASATPPDENAVDSNPPKRGWYNKLIGLLAAILCFEMGIFLVAFPWSGYWERNLLSWLSPGWREIWMNPYFRGCFSGLGFLNLYLSLLEILHLQDSGENGAPQA